MNREFAPAENNAQTLPKMDTQEEMSKKMKEMKEYHDALPSTSAPYSRLPSLPPSSSRSDGRQEGGP